MRNILILVFGVVALLLSKQVPAAMLKPTVTVEAETVRIGDLFDDVGPAADRVVLRAPPPGRRYVLDWAWLAEAARVHGIDWRPTSRFDRVVVERIGRVIGRDAIGGALKEALLREGAPSNIVIEFAGRAPELAVAIEATGHLDIQSLAYDRASGRFSALVLAGAGHQSAQRIPLAGRAVPTRTVPVLRRQVQTGEIVRADDVTQVEAREDTLRRDALVDVERVVGQSARRSLRPGEILRDGDLRAPVLVARNGLVTIMLRVGSMSLTAQGRALDEGARGETVRIMNVQSKRTIEAQVVGPDTVVVIAGGASPLVN
jgi:flagellar basal body P-ring formation protein FlgA